MYGSLVNAKDDSKHHLFTVQSHIEAEKGCGPFVTKVRLLIWLLVDWHLLAIKQSMWVTVSYVGPSIFNQDLHLIDQAYFPRLRTIRTICDPGF